MALGIKFSTVVPAAGYRWVPLDEHVAGYKTRAQQLEREWHRESDEQLKQVLAGRTRPPWNVAGDATAQLLLVPADDGHNAHDVKPLDLDSGLFRNFGNIDPTLQGVLEFANKYGQLFGCPYDDSEPFNEWEFEIRSMRFLVSIWDAVAAGRKTSVIDKHFTKDLGGGTIAYPFAEDIIQYHMFRESSGPGGPGEEILANASISFDIGHGEASGKPLDVALLYLTRAINRRLEACRVATALSTDGKLTLRPPMLLGAIWSQFAVAVSEAKQHRACEICGTFFELDPDLNRTSRVYCSDACRVQMHRNRKAKARRLHAAGKTFKQIATAMDSDVKTIKGWLKPRGG